MGDGMDRRTPWVKITTISTARAWWVKKDHDICQILNWMDQVSFFFKSQRNLLSFYRIILRRDYLIHVSIFTSHYRKGYKCFFLVLFIFDPNTKGKESSRNFWTQRKNNAGILLWQFWEKFLCSGKKGLVSTTQYTYSLILYAQSFTLLEPKCEEEYMRPLCS